MRIRKNKAQVEVIGLLIIVLMISFIMLFALTSSLRKSDNTVASYRQETLASSLISSILRTTTECNDNSPDMKELLIDCAKWNAYTSSITCYENDLQFTSCEYFENKTKTILDQTLGLWRKEYELIIIPPDGDFSSRSTAIIHIKGGNSTRFSGDMSAATQPLPIGTNYGSINLMLCIGGKCEM